MASDEVSFINPRPPSGAAMLLDSGFRSANVCPVLRDLINTYLNRGFDLPSEMVKAAVQDLVNSSVLPEEKAEFLTALANKGETAAEIAGFARELRLLSVVPPISAAVRGSEILDVCGTGGDQQNTFNISTTVGLVVASAGVYVAKHGNRAITSSSGSADVLETLGVHIDLQPQEAADCLEKYHFAFFFAQNYHPAFKNIAPARKLCAERKQRTIFNFLGPLLNPARPSAQLLGLPRPDLCKPIANVLQTLGLRRAMVVSGELEGAHLDEISPGGPTTVAEFYQDRGFNMSIINPADFGLEPSTRADLIGGDRQVSAQIVESILNGTQSGPKLEAVLLNAGAALFVADNVPSIADGIEKARYLIGSGAAAAKLAALRRYQPSR